MCHSDFELQLWGYDRRCLMLDNGIVPPDYYSDMQKKSTNYINEKSELNEMQKELHDLEMSDAISSDSDNELDIKGPCIDFTGCFKRHLEKKRQLKRV